MNATKHSLLVLYIDAALKENGLDYPENSPECRALLVEQFKRDVADVLEAFTREHTTFVSSGYLRDNRGHRP